MAALTRFCSRTHRQAHQRAEQATHCQQLHLSAAGASAAGSRPFLVPGPTCQHPTTYFLHAWPAVNTHFQPHLIVRRGTLVHGVLVAAAVVALVQAHPPALQLRRLGCPTAVNPLANRRLCRCAPPGGCCPARQQQRAVDQRRGQQLTGASLISGLLHQLQTALVCAVQAHVSTKADLQAADSIMLSSPDMLPAACCSRAHLASVCCC